MNQQKKIQTQQKRRSDPMRMCAACRARLPKKDMVRIALDGNREARVDIEGNLRGRGVNLCPKVECLTRALDARVFNRAWSGIQVTADADGLKRDFEELLDRKSFREGKEKVVYRIAKTEAELQIGHTVTRAT
jgi:uncharacterized protein